MFQRIITLSLGLLLWSCASLPPQSLSPISIAPPLVPVPLSDVELVSFRLDYSNRPDIWVKVDPFPLRRPQVLAQELFEAWSSRFPWIAPLFPSEPNFQPDPGSFIEILPHDSTGQIPGEAPRSPGKATPPGRKAYGLYLLVRLVEDQDTFGNVYQELEVVTALVNTQGTKVASASFLRPLGQSLVNGFVPALLPLEEDVEEWLRSVFEETAEENEEANTEPHEQRD
jgi:hypothetical protein